MIQTMIYMRDMVSPKLRQIERAITQTAEAAEIAEKQMSLFGEAGVLERMNQEVGRMRRLWNRVKGAVGGAVYRLDDWVKKSREAKTETSGLARRIKQIVSLWAGMKGLQLFVQTADDLALIEARTKNVLKSFGEAYDTKAVAAYQKEIMASAQRSRGAYQMTADIIGKLGMQAKGAFGNSRELIQFSEVLNKTFKVAGTDAEGVRSVMYNLTQAMASGILRGQDLNAVMSNTPMILEKVAAYLGTDISQIRALAEQGALTADIIKNAMLASAEEIDQVFQSMPMTFQDIIQNIKNRALGAFEGAARIWTNLLQSEAVMIMVDEIVGAISFVAEVFAGVVMVVADGMQILHDCGVTLLDLIHFIIGAYILWKGVTIALKIAQLGLNAALMSNPLGLILKIVGLIILLFLQWANSVGGIQYAFEYLVRGIIKWALWLAKTIAPIFEGIVNATIWMINAIIKGLNKIPGVNIQLIEKANFASKADDVYKSFSAKSAKRLADLKSKHEARQREADIVGGAHALGNSAPAPVKAMAGDVGGIAKNTGSIKDSLEQPLSIESEDLSLIRDVMTQRAIQYLSWDKIEVKVDNSFGDIHETADLDAWITGLEEGLREAIATTGV